MNDVEPVYADEMAKRLYEAITETRSPSEQTFYREAAHRLQASGAMTLLPMDDSYGPYPEDENEEGENVINMRRALQVSAISVGILRTEDGRPALVGHFGGVPRGEESNVGVAWLMGQEAVTGMFRQVVEAAAAVDLAMAGAFVGAAVAAMERSIATKSNLAIPGRYDRRN